MEQFAARKPQRKALSKRESNTEEFVWLKCKPQTPNPALDQKDSNPKAETKGLTDALRDFIRLAAQRKVN